MDLLLAGVSAAARILSIQEISCVRDSDVALHLTVAYEVEGGSDDLVEVLFISEVDEADCVSIRAAAIVGRMAAGTREVVACDEPLDDATRRHLSSDAQVLSRAAREWQERLAA